MKVFLVCCMLIGTALPTLLSTGCATDGDLSIVEREDRTLAALVRERIQMDPVARRAMVNVDVQYGFATIYGDVDNPALLARIISIVRNTPGIRGVEKGDRF
jgi:osmotically-inducible protein OsmY